MLGIRCSSLDRGSGSTIHARFFGEHVPVDVHLWDLAVLADGHSLDSQFGVRLGVQTAMVASGGGCASFVVHLATALLVIHFPLRESRLDDAQ